MKKIKIKGVLAGVIAACILIIFVSILGYFTEHGIANHAENYQGNMDYFNETGIKGLLAYIKFQPLLFTLNIITMFIIVGIPGYIAAKVAKQNYILHSMIIGLIYSCMPFILEGIPSFTAHDLLLYILILPISYLSGYICTINVYKL